MYIYQWMNLQVHPHVKRRETYGIQLKEDNPELDVELSQPQDKNRQEKKQRNINHLPHLNYYGLPILA